MIFGSISEYGLRTSGGLQLPSVAADVRMINVSDGSVIWSISDSAMGAETDTISLLSVRLVQRMVNKLRQRWVSASDTLAVNLPVVQPQSILGGLREITISFAPQPIEKFKKYRLYRSRSLDGQYELFSIIGNTKKFTAITHVDKKLLDSETYYYKVVGVTPSGLNSAFSGVFNATTAGLPNVVYNFSAQSQQAQKIPLSWHPNTDPFIKGYNLYRSLNEIGPFQKVSFVNGAKKDHYLDKGNPVLNDFTDYYISNIIS